MPQPLAQDQIAEAVAQLEHWRVDNARLCRTFVFADFVQALGFMVRVGTWSEKLNHHPEWRNVYNRVEVELITHDVDAITTLDLELATKMNELAQG